MEEDLDMAELYDGSTESDEDRFIYTLSDSYETLVLRSSYSLIDITWLTCIYSVTDS